MNSNTIGNMTGKCYFIRVPKTRNPCKHSIWKK